jgi:hypothetical protein
MARTITTGEMNVRIAIITPITERARRPQRCAGGADEERQIPPPHIERTKIKIPTKYTMNSIIPTGKARARIPIIRARTPLMRSDMLMKEGQEDKLMISMQSTYSLRLFGPHSTNGFRDSIKELRWRRYVNRTGAAMSNITWNTTRLAMPQPQ